MCCLEGIYMSFFQSQNVRKVKKSRKSDAVKYFDLTKPRVCFKTWDYGQDCPQGLLALSSGLGGSQTSLHRAFKRHSIVWDSWCEILGGEEDERRILDGEERAGGKVSDGFFIFNESIWKNSVMKVKEHERALWDADSLSGWPLFLDLGCKICRSMLTAGSNGKEAPNSVRCKRIKTMIFVG